MSIYRFGAYRLDATGRELWRHDERLAASPRAFECLVYLLEHRDRAVGRDELVAAVWGRESVSDNLLGKTVLKARRLVGDNGGAQEVVRTIPRFGYRWVAAVETDVATAPARKTAREPPRRRPRGLWALAAGGVLAGALLVLAQLHDPISAPPATEVASADGLVAVLPFEVVADEDWSWLRYGLMDLATARLRNAGFAVVPSETTVSIATRASTAADAGAQLAQVSRAEHIVRARVRQSAYDWRVRFELLQSGRVVREIEVQRADALDATQEACARLAAVLDPRRAEVAPAPSAADSLTELLQRSEAAVLSEDFERARGWIEAAPASLREEPELRLRKALIDYRLGRYDAAAHELEFLAAHLSNAEEPLLRARALMGLGAVALRRGLGADAGRAFDAALTQLPERSDPLVRGYAFMGRGTAHALAARYAAASADFAQARLRFEAGGDGLALARIDMGEGVMSTSAGAHDEAQALLQRATQRFERLGTASELGSALSNQIELLLLRLQPRAAQPLAERLRPLIERIENPLERHLLVARRIEVLAALGRGAEAQALREELERSIDPHDERELLGRIRLGQAEAAYEEGGLERAATLSEQAARLLPAVSPEYARALLLGLRSHSGRGDRDEAAQALAALQTAGEANAAARSRALLASAELALPTLRRAAYERALEATAASAPAERMPLIESYVHWLVDVGDLARASALAGQAARWAGQDFRSALVQLRLHHARGDTAAWRTALAQARDLAGTRPIPGALREKPVAQPIVSSS